MARSDRGRAPGGDHGDGQRVVVITGGSSGLGRCTARLFARRGWRVGLIARGLEGLDETRADVEREGAVAAVAVADVTDMAALEAAAVGLESALGPIDVWVNNAGAGILGRVLDVTESEFRAVTDVTYFGQVHGTRVALGRMRPRDRGTIVNVCSVVSYRAVPLQTPYSAAKYAVRGFTEGLRAELVQEGSGVRLCIVHPPAMNTPFFSHAVSKMPDGGVPKAPPPVYEPEVGAGAIYHAAVSGRRETVVGGASVAMVWANTLAPGLNDWVLGRLAHAMSVTRRADAKASREPSLFAAHKRISDVRGPFGRGALRHSAQMWVVRHGGMAGLSAIASLAGLAGLALWRHRAAGRHRPVGRVREAWSRSGA